MRRQFSKIAFVAGFGLALAFTFSCSSRDDGGGPTPSSSPSTGISSSSKTPASSSSRGNGGSDVVGRTVQIGNQTWMAENLNDDVSGSVCYDNDPANCSKYGRLYDWETAKTVCPSGWHLPSNAEWSALISYVENDKGCSSCAGKYLKATTGWLNDGNSTDDYDFSALPGGFGYSSGNFRFVGNGGYWWTATENGAIVAYYRYMSYSNAIVSSDYYDKTDLYSVRCLQD